MRAVRFAKIDFRQSKNMVLFSLGFCLLGVIISIMGSDAPFFFPMLYGLFGYLVVVSNPFFYSGNDNFIRMLPANPGSRVVGRYLYGMTFVFIVAAEALPLNIGLILWKGQAEAISDLLAFTAGTIGAVLVITSLEFLAFYFLELKNPSVMSVLRMIPAFVLFFGFSSFIESAGEGGIQWMVDVIKWITENALLFGMVLLLCGMVSMALSAAAVVARKKIVMDY